MTIIVCGGRTFGRLPEERDLAIAVLGGALRAGDVVIHGDAPGADRLAAQAARVLGLESRAYPARWDVHGPAAGPIRNAEMLSKARPGLVIALPGGRGTSDMIRRAKRAGVPVMEVTAA